MTGWWHEERIRERAYDLWERAGRPEGRAVEYWLQAEREIAAEEEGLQEEIALEEEGAI
jgi:Protein of unknown function (DUF2934)